MGRFGGNFPKIRNGDYVSLAGSTWLIISGMLLSFVKCKFWAIKICKILPLGGVAAFVYFFVFGHFSHVPHWFIKVFLHDVHKFYKIKLFWKRKWVYCLFTRKRRFCKQAICDLCFMGSRGLQGTKMDLNTKSLPKQKTIKSLIYKTQGFQITINENPPMREIFFIKFWFTKQGSNHGPLN